MSDINFRLLENVFERKKEQTGYFIGEQKKDMMGKNSMK